LLEDHNSSLETKLLPFLTSYTTQCVWDNLCMAVNKVTLIVFIVNVKQVQMGNNLRQKCSVILKVFPSVLGQS